jgi:hypothetical protein
MREEVLALIWDAPKEKEFWATRTYRPQQKQIKIQQKI